MIDIIMDTDMGVDSDDAVALALLMSLQRRGDVCVRAVTTSSSREGASACVQAIMRFYGAEAPLAQMQLPGLACDRINNYARAVMKRYSCLDAQDAPVPLLRKILSQREGQIILATGPLTNIAELLASPPDSISALDGKQLVKRSVSMLYSMAGCFDGGLPEWNVLQDIPAAQYVFRHCPVPITVVPFETGSGVKTGAPFRLIPDHPVWYAMKCFAINEFGASFAEDNVARDSWDPVTAMLASGTGTGLFSYERGTVSVEDDGTSVFRKSEDGAHIVVRPNTDRELVRKVIDTLLQNNSPASF